MARCRVSVREIDGCKIAVHFQETVHDSCRVDVSRFAFGAFQFPGCCLVASVFSTSSLDRDRTQHRRSGLSYRSGRILGGSHSDLLREIPQTRRGKERLLYARPSSPIFISSAGRAWSAHRLATFYPAHRLYPYALILLPAGAAKKSACNHDTEICTSGLCEALPCSCRENQADGWYSCCSAGSAIHG
jgi:hypothetical protein